MKKWWTGSGQIGYGSTSAAPTNLAQNLILSRNVSLTATNLMVKDLLILDGASLRYRSLCTSTEYSARVHFVCNSATFQHFSSISTTFQHFSSISAVFQQHFSILAAFQHHFSISAAFQQHFSTVKFQHFSDISAS